MVNFRNYTPATFGGKKEIYKIVRVNEKYWIMVVLKYFKDCSINFYYPVVHCHLNRDIIKFPDGTGRSCKGSRLHYFLECSVKRCTWEKLNSVSNTITDEFIIYLFNNHNLND